MIDVSKDRMCCLFCLFFMKAGLSNWCDYHEKYTEEFEPSCEDFRPNGKAIGNYEALLKKLKQN